MFLRPLTLLFFCLFSATGYAQQVLKARVFENKTRIGLAGIRVRNITNKQNTNTDNDGRFNIQAKINDVLVLTGFSYETDTLLVTNMREKEIFLEPKGTLLKEVKVATPETNLGTLTAPELHNQTVVYKRDAQGYYKGGIGINIFSSKSEENKRKKLEQIEHEDQVRRDIDKVFSQPNLVKYLPLKPEELAGFKTRYTPSVPVFTSKKFNLLFYVDSCYKEFKKLPPEQRTVQKLGDN